MQAKSKFDIVDIAYYIPWSTHLLQIVACVFGFDFSERNTWHCTINIIFFERPWTWFLRRIPSNLPKVEQYFPPMRSKVINVNRFFVRPNTPRLVFASSALFFALRERLLVIFVSVFVSWDGFFCVFEILLGSYIVYTWELKWYVLFFIHVNYQVLTLYTHENYNGAYKKKFNT
jgi:hypothetical protein